MKPLGTALRGLAIAGMLIMSGAASSDTGGEMSWLSGLRWVNSRPISAADLKGKVVVVEFWTFDCINCRRTVPAMRKLAGIYRGAKDVVIIGIHTPELDRERRFENVLHAVERLQLGF